MNLTFETIGLELPSETAYNRLAQRAGDQGEASQLSRRGSVLHGRCWKLGEGLEVWTVLFESGSGDIFYADCRPGFRARYVQRISPWALTEYDEEGEALVHGFCEHSETEVLFELQNLTEVGATVFQGTALPVSLCGLAYRARVNQRVQPTRWEILEKSAPTRAAHENDWSLCGQIITFKPLRNPLSGTDLYWVYLDLGAFRLEVLVNHRALRGDPIAVGASLAAEIWLQGHVLDDRDLRSRYEGVGVLDSASFWRHLRRSN